MRRDEVRGALDAMASAVSRPSADADAVVADGRRRIRRRRFTLAGVVALLVAIVLAAGAIARTDDGAPRVASVPTTVHSIQVVPQITTPAHDAYTGPVRIPLAFVSPTEGWLCSTPTMEYTISAGATWKNVAVPSRPPTSPRVQQPVCAAIPGGDAWMITTAKDPDDLQVIHVSVGGRVAETSAFPSLPDDWTVRELSFADRRDGWAFARDAAGAATATYVTTDGGRTWDSETPVRHAPFFATPSDGWAALDISTVDLTHTTDGGHAWERVPSSGLYDGMLQPIAARGDTLVALFTATDGSITRPSFAVSTDGGRDWTQRPAPPHVITSPAEPIAASAIDANHWQLGVGSRLWTTTNAGRSWTPVAEFAGVSQITDVHFLTPDLGFVSATGIGPTADATEVLQTTDGGDTWTTVDVHAPPMGSHPTGVNFPGGIFGCPTKPLAAPPPGNPPPGLIEAATRWAGDNGSTVATIDATYRVGEQKGEFWEVFNFQIPSCGPSAVGASWVVEMHGPIGQGGGGSTDQTQVVLAYSPDGWHVYGRYH